MESVSKLSWFLSVQLHIYIVRYSLLTHQHDVVSARTARSQGSSRNELSWGFWTMSPDRRNIYVLCTIWNFKLCRMCIDIFDLIIWQVLVTDIIHLLRPWIEIILIAFVPYPIILSAGKIVIADNMISSRRSVEFRLILPKKNGTKIITMEAADSACSSVQSSTSWRACLKWHGFSLWGSTAARYQTFLSVWFAKLLMSDRLGRCNKAPWPSCRWPFLVNILYLHNSPPCWWACWKYQISPYRPTSYLNPHSKSRWTHIIELFDLCNFPTFWWACRTPQGSSHCPICHTNNHPTSHWPLVLDLLYLHNFPAYREEWGKCPGSSYCEPATWILTLRIVDHTLSNFLICIIFQHSEGRVENVKGPRTVQSATATLTLRATEHTFSTLLICAIFQYIERHEKGLRTVQSATWFTTLKATDRMLTFFLICVIFQHSEGHAENAKGPHTVQYATWVLALRAVGRVSSIFLQLVCTNDTPSLISGHLPSVSGQIYQCQRLI